MLGTRESWWEQAACSGIDVDVFYPLPNDAVTTKQALQVCGRCPIRVECLQYAIRNRETYGIWGGTTERQRSPVLRGHPTTSRRLRRLGDDGAKARASGWAAQDLGPELKLDK